MEQLLPRQLLAGAHDAGEAAVAGGHLVQLAALAAELERQLGAVDLDVIVTDRGQAEALVLARVLGVADPDQGALEQAHDGRQHLLARQAVAPHVGIEPRADLRQRPTENQHAVELVRVAHRAPLGVVAVLLAPAVVAAGRLDVAARMRADPDVGPGRRDRERAQPADLGGLLDRPALRVAIAEGAARAPAGDPGHAVGDVAKAGRLRRRGRSLGIRLGRQGDLCDLTVAALHVVGTVPRG